MTEPKALDVQNMDDLKAKVPDVAVVGEPGAWRMLCKASSKSQCWMKSTKVMTVPGGVVLQVSTQQGANVAEAVTFIPGVTVTTGDDGSTRLAPLNG